MNARRGASSPGEAHNFRPGDASLRPGGVHPGDYAEAVLAVVEAIPPGRVMSYGDIAEFLGTGGPRQVGSVLSREGSAVPWWRVVHSDGTAPPGKDGRALREWVAERVPLRLSGRVDMTRARWVPPPADSGERRSRPAR